MILLKKYSKLLFFVFIFISFLISGCSKSSINEIDYKKFNDLINQKKNFILYIGSTSCHNCNEFKPKLESVANENNISNIYYIDLDKLSTNEKNNFNKVINITGTPTVVFIANGEEQSSFNRINGNVDKEKIIKRLKANDYIK